MRASFWLMLTMAAVMLVAMVSLLNILDLVSTAQGQPGLSVLFVDADHQEALSMEQPSFMPAPALMPKSVSTQSHSTVTSATPGAGRIAFVSDQDGDDEIYVMNADGSAVTKLTDNPNKDWWPSWSPDGRRIVFNSDRDGDQEVYVMNADGSGLAQLTSNSASDWFAKWSPDGRQITFASTRDGDHEIYVMNADGSGLTRLTDNSETDWLPSWSPDGRRIAFTATRDENTDLYVMNIDGSGVTRLTHHSAGDYDPNWSPDGRRIAFQSDRDGDYELYVMNADGSGVTQLTHNSEYDGQLEWSQHGLRIAFNSDRDGDDEIYLMNPDGTGITKLTDNSAKDSAASWAPATIEATFLPELITTPDSYDFGTVIQGDTPEALFSVTNAASGTLQWEILDWPNWVEIISLYTTKGSGEGSLRMGVRDDAPLGQLTGTITFNSNGGDGPIFLSAHLVAAARPDLIIENVKMNRGGPSSLFIFGDTVTIHFSITNIGTGPAEASWLTYHIGNSSREHLFQTEDLPTLGPGESSSHSIRYTFTDADIGVQRFRLVAHYGPDVDGLDEANNTAWTSDFHVVPGPQPSPTPTITPVPPPPTNTPVPSPIPTSTPTPTPTPTVLPPPTPVPGGPLVDFHAETTETKTSQPVDISLAVVNLKTNPDIDVHVVLRSPTGLQLTGDSCSSVAQCSDAYELSAGAQRTMSLRATANEAGQFTMEAYVTWKAKDGEPAHLKEPLKLRVLEPIEGETEVTLHATQTDIQVGEPVRLNLSAINSIVKPPMTLTLMIKAPSGWSLTGTGFATACGPQCSTTYNLESGQQRYIDVDMVPNQPGNFEVEARMEWYFGDDTSTLERKMETLQLNVLGDPTPPPATEASGSNGNEQSSPTTGPGTRESWVQRNWEFLILLLVGIVILAVLGWIFGRPLDRIRPRS